MTLTWESPWPMYWHFLMNCELRGGHQKVAINKKTLKHALVMNCLTPEEAEIRGYKVARRHLENCFNKTP